MQGLSTRTYNLAIKKKKKDYILLDVNKLPGFENENLNTLGGIDSFTSKQFKTDLLDSVIHEGIMKNKKDFVEFVPVYTINGKFREVKEGTIFKEDEIDISYDAFIDLFIKNGEDKTLRNYILKLDFGDMKSLALEKFLDVIADYESIMDSEERIIKKYLSIVKDVPYQEYRILAINTYKKIKGIS